MCLQTIWTNRKIRRWLRKQPDVISAFKVAHITYEGWSPRNPQRLFPPYYTNEQKSNYYRRQNRLPETTSLIKKDKAMRQSFIGRKHLVPYTSYFYLYIERKWAENCKKWYMRHLYQRDLKIIECIIPKELIHVVGEQEGTIVVTRGFDIIGEDIYFEEEKCV